MSTEAIVRYVDKVPNEVWLVGKGPSLDTYDWSKASWCRVAINEAAFIVPQCWGAFAVDTQVLNKFADSDIIIFKRYEQRKYVFKKMYNYVKRIEAQSYHATAPIAVQVLHYLGANIIHFVGFDSFDELHLKRKRIPDFAQLIEDISAKGTNKDNYKSINKSLKRLIQQLNITAIWEHRTCLQ